MVATPEVAPGECTPTSFISVDVTLFVPSNLDLNENGIPDECEVICGTLPGDLDGDGVVDGDDITAFIDCFLQGPSITSGCGCADMNSPDPDGVLDQTDIAELVLALLSQ
jgi:hypothetical protein